MPKQEWFVMSLIKAVTIFAQSHYDIPQCHYAFPLCEQLVSFLQTQLNNLVVNCFHCSGITHRQTYIYTCFWFICNSETKRHWVAKKVFSPCLLKEFHDCLSSGVCLDSQIRCHLNHSRKQTKHESAHLTILCIACLDCTSKHITTLSDLNKHKKETYSRYRQHFTESSF